MAASAFGVKNMFPMAGLTVATAAMAVASISSHPITLTLWWIFVTTLRIAPKRAKKARSGNCTGKRGQDLYVPVPTGTIVYDSETGETLGDLVQVGDTLLVAQGGFHGLGNTRFKSSTNRAPEKATKGSAGEKRLLSLELKLIADVGLLGMPNAWQVQPDSCGVLGQAESRRLSFHHLAPKFGRSPRGREPQFCHGRYSGLD